MAINSATVIGNLGSDPQVRDLPSGTKVANFSLATTLRFSDRMGQKREITDWHRVVAYGKLAETVGMYLTKGRQVYVEGRLSTRSFDSKDGSGKRFTTEIIARRVSFLGGRPRATETMNEEEVPF